jgi:hypothetical protein
MAGPQSFRVDATIIRQCATDCASDITRLTAVDGQLQIQLCVQASRLVHSVGTVVAHHADPKNNWRRLEPGEIVNSEVVNKEKCLTGEPFRPWAAGNTQTRVSNVERRSDVRTAPDAF